ncbi:hypothetical protein ACHAXS_012988 [Conticribra weissflogii]
MDKTECLSAAPSNHGAPGPSAPATPSPMQQPQPQKQQPSLPPHEHNSKLRRRSSMNANDANGFDANMDLDDFPDASIPEFRDSTIPVHRSDRETCYPDSEFQLPDIPALPPIKSVARLCGTSRSRCGYCAGKRLHVLEEFDDYNTALQVKATKNSKLKLDSRREKPRGKTGNPEVDNGEDEDDDEEEEEIDENNTSKSYGLLFDSLPFDTYLEFINRGWRRSGKHLYHPHNFESCCPAISIRLDVSRFAPNTSPQSERYGVSEGDSNLAKVVLVGGSKSQRKVGKRILHALEKYNSNIDSIQNSRKCESPSHTGPLKFLNTERSSMLSSSSASTVNATKIERMQLEDIDVEIPIDKDVHSHDEENSETLRKSKKFRRFSPLSTSILEEALSPNEIQSIQSSSKSQRFNLDFDRRQLQLIEESEKSLLAKLGEIVYETITKEAIKKTVKSSSDGQSVSEPPQWAWWKADGSVLIELPKWSTFKIAPNSAKTIPPSEYSTSELAEDEKDVTLVVSTAACAAASGRSRGMIDKVNLARAVVEEVKSAVSDDSFQAQSILSALEVSYHEKSGHVQVKCLASSKALSLIVAKKAPPPKVPKPAKNDKKANAVCPITEFLSRHRQNQAKLFPASKPCSNTTDYDCKKRFLTVRSIPVFESSLQPEVHELFCRYQASVHGDSNPFEDIVNGSESDTVNSSYASDGAEYAFYQREKHPGFLDIDTAYHHLDESQRAKIKKSYLSFYRFLCETPLGQMTKRASSHPSINNDNDDGYDVSIPHGTYHQQYRLSTSPSSFDGPLLAVGVVDLLPTCLSSVYAFYDPRLSTHLELGKYTALREIEWVRRAMRLRSDLHYYYLGYYIHSCQKMIYKAEYKPSELLCPINLKWVDFEVAKKMLEERSPVRHCAPLCDETSEDDGANADLDVAVARTSVCTKPKEKRCGLENHIDDVTIDIGAGAYVKVGHLNDQGRALIDPIVHEFVKEVGIDMCEKLVIKLA